MFWGAGKRNTSQYEESIGPDFVLIPHFYCCNRITPKESFTMRRGLVWVVVLEARRFIMGPLCLTKVFCWVNSKLRDTWADLQEAKPRE